jgi:hypothetical protein
MTLGVALMTGFGATAAEIQRDDVYGCWKNDNGGTGDLCFSPDARVVYKGQQAPKPAGSEGYEFAFADNSLIFIDKQKNIPSGICKIGDRSEKAIELSCDDNGKIYNGKWTKRCVKVNPEGTDCL